MSTPDTSTPATPAPGTPATATPAPGTPALRAPAGAIAGAWAMAITGLLWASLLSFAASMMTAPRQSLSGALFASPMPLLAIWLAVGVVRRARRGEVPGWTLWAVLPVFLVAALALFVGWAIYLRLGLR
ncbi:MAG TPA: hypothetical protein VK610_09320 [Rhodothermales bacterium]|nr:hypothetical protein [Rhodothermales bacterium]